MAKSAQRRVPDIERSSHEVLEGIHLVGEEAPSLELDSLWRRAWGEELRRVQARGQLNQPMIRGYVGGLKKVLG